MGSSSNATPPIPGKRFETPMHKQVLKDHGFAAIAPVDVMGEKGSISLPVSGGKNLTENFVGANFVNYDSFLILSHFKGHAMGGYGGALKNMSIGIAFGEGNMWIHTAGATRSLDNFNQCFSTEQDLFLESMVEAAGSVINKLQGNLIYINLMNNLSVDCACDNDPAPPKMKDIGILASVDPVALDRACIDLVYAADGNESAICMNVLNRETVLTPSIMRRNLVCDVRNTSWQRFESEVSYSRMSHDPAFEREQFVEVLKGGKR